ncbi:Hypothetical predicted protein, partial [Paramuricea clavata]
MNQGNSFSERDRESLTVSPRHAQHLINMSGEQFYKEDMYGANPSYASKCFQAHPPGNGSSKVDTGLHIGHLSHKPRTLVTNSSVVDVKFHVSAGRINSETVVKMFITNKLSCYGILLDYNTISIEIAALAKFSQEGKLETNVQLHNEHTYILINHGTKNLDKRRNSEGKFVIAYKCIDYRKMIPKHYTDEAQKAETYDLQFKIEPVIITADDFTCQGESVDQVVGRDRKHDVDATARLGETQ